MEQRRSAVDETVVDPAESRPRAWRLPLAAGLVLVLAVGGWLGYRWWSTPDVFESLGDRMVLAPQPLPRAALTTTVVLPDVDATEAEVVTVTAIEAVFERNTAEATAVFSLCDPVPGAAPIGAVHGTSRWCTDLAPVDVPFALSVGPDEGVPYLVVTIEPRSAGRAHLTEVVLSYRRGAEHLWQRGTQTLRVDRTVVVR